MKSLIIILGGVTATLAGPVTISADPLAALKSGALAKPGYSLTWADTFSGRPGYLPSRSNWIFSLGTSYPGGAPRWGNNEFQSYTDDTSNVHITKQQNLAITPQLKNGQWTSARIESQRTDFVAAKGGKLFVEASIKLGTAPLLQQQGIWPAFWSLGSEFRGNYTNWPLASEWDFLEAVNGANTMHSVIHCGFAPGGPCNEFDGLGNGGVDFSRGVFHTVGFVVDRSMTGKGKKGTWKDETLTWYLDGKLVHKITGARVGDEPTWGKLAHEKHFLLFNVAVGGNWPGPPNNLTADGPSVGMEVGYVGVWNSL